MVKLWTQRCRRRQRRKSRIKQRRIRERRPTFRRAMYVCTAFVFAVADSRGGSWKILCLFAPHLSVYIKSFLV